VSTSSPGDAPAGEVSLSETPPEEAESGAEAQDQPPLEEPPLEQPPLEEQIGEDAPVDDTPE